MYSATLLSLNYQVRLCESEFFFQRSSCSCRRWYSMPALSKRARMLDEVAGYHVQRKRARILHMLTQFIDDLPSSDSQANPRSSSPSSLSTISSPSGLSDPSSSPRVSLDTSSGHSSTTSGRSSGDFDSFEDQLLERWDAQIQTLATHLLTARVLDFSPPVKKLGQLDLYLTDFRQDHPDRFRKKLRVSPLVFDRLVELIKDHNVFHNNSHIPQHPVPVQLAIFLVRVGHYGNASAPEYVAQWAGVCVGTVINATYRCLVAFLALHDEVVMMPPEEEKERAKEYVERATCPEWRNGFLLADGTKFALFQKPGLHGEAWFDKNKNYSIDCQVSRGDLFFQVSTQLTVTYFSDHQFASKSTHRRLLVGPHRQRSRRVGFPKHAYVQEPREYIRAW
jgi:hypothetical protein